MLNGEVIETRHAGMGACRSSGRQTPSSRLVGARMNEPQARNKAAAAASAEARNNGWFMAIAVVDPAGTLVYFEKADNTQLASPRVAIDKARSAALYKRPTKAFQLSQVGGGARRLARPFTSEPAPAPSPARPSTARG